MLISCAVTAQLICAFVFAYECCWLSYAVSHLMHLSLCMSKPTIWFQTRYDTNQAVQSQKQARSLKFRILEEEGLYYLCSENKGADQLRGHREADLRLCFRLCKLLIFSCTGSSVFVGLCMQ